MTDTRAPPDRGSQPDRPVPFPATVRLDAPEQARLDPSSLYDRAPQREPVGVAPKTPAVPVPVLVEKRRPSPSTLVVLLLAIGGVLAIFARLEAQPIQTEPTPAPPPLPVVAAHADPTPVPPEPLEIDPAAALEQSLAHGGLTLDDARRIESTKDAAATYSADPADPDATRALTDAVAAVKLTRSDVKRKLYHLTKLLRALDERGAPKKVIGPAWRSLIEIRRDFEADDPDLTALAQRMTALEGQSKPLLAEAATP